MTTNYYVEDDPTCDNPAHTLTLHIGNSAMGWKFLLHAIPAKGLTTWAAWQGFLAGREIRDEYDRVHTLEEFTSLVEGKQRSEGRPPDKPNICHLDYMAANYPGQVQEAYLHDEQGYDLHLGEFS